MMMRFVVLGVMVVGAVACGDSDSAPDAAVDASIDVALDPCAACTADEVCVQRFDGTCGVRFHACVERTEECPQNACSEACEDAYCGSDDFQCMTRSPCGTESPGAFTCYGV